MSKDFLDYSSPEQLNKEFALLCKRVFCECDVRDPGREASFMAFLQPIRAKDLATFEHSRRVGVLASKLTEFMHLDHKVGFYSGCLHDVGKVQTNLETLQRTDNWTPADTKEIKNHVLDGYRMLRGRFDFTAEVILWHHRFQSNRYPERVPSSLHEYSEGTRVIIPFYGRILSLCDVYDALHRVNSKHGASMTGEGIRQILKESNPDLATLIEEAYEEGIFTISTEINNE